MGDTKTQVRQELRIYCLCGQKMRVSSSMYGRPGKCVACRQKIRIPRLDEIPAGTSEIYLRDHPEFLRKSAGHEAKRGNSPEFSGGNLLDPVPDQDLVLGDESDTERAAPIDPLRPLQMLCSFEARIAERLNELREAVQDTERAREKTALMGYRALVRNARADFDEQLRQRLHEVTDQLSDTRERIARASLALRVGDLSYNQYVDTISPLRIRRDRLERRRVNLAGWLHTHDPHLAGGMIDLPYEEIPVTSIEVGFPVDDHPATTLLQACLGTIRDALTEREEARRKLEGVQRMQREDSVPQEQTRRLIKDADARVQRARVRVEFERGRAEQYVQDCESDIRAIRAHLEEAQTGVENARLSPQDYAEVEHHLLQAQGDLNESRALARKALRAERPVEVPGPKSTFIRRMQKRDTDPAMIENITAWIASFALAVAAVLPLVSGQMGSNLANLPWLVAVFLASALAFAGSTMLPSTPMRGLAMLSVWVFASVTSVYLLRSAMLELTPLGGIMRTHAQWFLTPGMLVYLISLAGLGLAASVTLARFERWRSVPLIGAMLTVALISLIVTDGARIAVSRPELGVPVVSRANPAEPVAEVSIPVTNSGFRPYWIGGSLERVPDPVRFVLEKKVGEQLSWEDYTSRQLVQAPGGASTGNTPLQQLPVTRVSPGETRNIRYALEPGQYRASLISIARGPSWERMLEFAVAAPTEPAPSAPSESEAETASSQGRPQTPAVNDLKMATVRLQGVLGSQGRDPQFSIVLEMDDGRIVNQRVGLGGQIAGQWYASEYSPANQSLTITDGENLLILERSQGIRLEYSDEARDSEEAQP